MPSKPLELPLKVAKAFARDMQAFFEEENAIKRDEIAARQLHALQAFQKPREKGLRLADVKEMFLQMKDIKIALPLCARRG
jgi:septin family protein